MSREIYRQKRSTDSCSVIIRDGVAAAWPSAYWLRKPVLRRRKSV